MLLFQDSVCVCEGVGGGVVVGGAITESLRHFGHVVLRFYIISFRAECIILLEEKNPMIDLK